MATIGCPCHDFPMTIRIERDSMGEVRLPAGAYYGPQTQRAVENFPISGRTLPPELIHALGLVEMGGGLRQPRHGPVGECRANSAIPPRDRRPVGRLPRGGRGKLDDQFPVDVFQTGSGTSSNMNANEVIASRASEISGQRSAVGSERHEVSPGRQISYPARSIPNDHVNLGQSSNDVFPTAIHVAVAPAIRDRLIPALKRCGEVLAEKAAAVERRSEDRPHPPGRRRADDARPGDRRPCPAVAAIGPPGQSCDRSPLGIAHWRHGRGHGRQHPSRFRPPRLRAAGPRDRHPLRRGGRPFRGQRPARRAGRVSRAVAHHCRHAFAVANNIRWLASAPAAASTKLRSPTASRAVRSCRARSIRSSARA